MHGARAELLTASGTKQAAGKTKHEETRKRISAQLSQIYTETKTAVDDRLKKLDDDVAKTFDEGASAAKSDFYIFIAANLLVYYVSGGWIADAFTGGDSKETIFKEGRDTYMQAMERVIDQVADVVEAGLNDVVELIKAGKAKLDTAVAAMDPAEQEVAREVETTIQGQFSDLEKSVADKQQEIIDSIAQKYVAAQKDVDATISALRDPVGALIDIAVESVSGVIDTILKMKELLLSALAKAQDAVELIITDPIGFLGNLVAGVKQGVMNFVENIGTHLKKGLLEWLFGALAGAGIQLPEKFDLSGLMSIVLQVLGLTWSNIRKRAVAIVGENVVQALEKASEIVITLVTKGPAGLWEYVKEQAATLLETLKESIKSFVIDSVVKAGLKWLLGLLNPASAFVKACMAIVDIVSFVIDRGQQILEFVNAVLDSVLAIAKGQIGVAAKAVEGALAKAVPVAIGFLASLAGLGDLSADIKKVIDKIQAPVNKVIDWVIKKAVSLVKAIGKMLGFGGKDGGAAGTAPTIKIDKPFAMSGEGHTLFVSSAGGDLVFEMASDRREGLKERLRRAQDEAAERTLAQQRTRPLNKALKKVEAELDSAEELYTHARYGPPRLAGGAVHEHENLKVTKELEDKIGEHAVNAAGLLGDIGRQYGLCSLEDLGHASNWVTIENELKNEYRGESFRPKVYGGWNVSRRAERLTEFDRLKLLIPASHTGPTTKTSWYCPTCGHVVENIRNTPGELTFDHTPSVVIHWLTEGGNDMSHDERNAWFNGQGPNLATMCRGCNSAKGGGDHEPNSYKVGPKFRGKAEGRAQ